MREDEIGERWPEVPEWADPRELDPEVRRDLRGLSKEGSEFVGAHLFMAGMLAEEDPALAWRHARAARSKGGRIAVVRETVGLVAYHAGEWAEAISELRAARRMTGGPGQLPVMADCERALGHPEKSIELSRSAEAADLDPSSAAELRIVVAGARADLGQLDAALAHLEGALHPETVEPFTARLYYAYADLLLQADRRAEAVDWFMKAAEVDVDEETDAGERLTELAGESGESDSDELEDNDGVRTEHAVDDLDDNLNGLHLGAAAVHAEGFDREAAEDDGDEVLEDDAAGEPDDDDAVAAGDLDKAGLAENDEDLAENDEDLAETNEDEDLAQNDLDEDVENDEEEGLVDDEGDAQSGDIAVVETAGVESNVAAAADDEDDDSDYAANDMDADDDTDDATIRPANVPRSMGSLFSHNEGGR